MDVECRHSIFRWKFTWLAVEANGIKADSHGEIITRNYNWRNLDWNDNDKNIQASLVGEFDLFNLKHTLITGLEFEDYDYRSYIIRSTAPFDPG